MDDFPEEIGCLLVPGFLVGGGCVLQGVVGEVVLRDCVAFLRRLLEAARKIRKVYSSKGERGNGLPDRLVEVLLRPIPLGEANPEIGDRLDEPLVSGFLEILEGHLFVLGDFLRTDQVLEVEHA